MTAKGENEKNGVGHDCDLTRATNIHSNSLDPCGPPYSQTTDVWIPFPPTIQ